MALIWLLHISIIAWLLLKYYKTQRNTVIGHYYWYGIAAKVLGGILSGVFYKFYFQGGDTWAFFESSKVVAQWGASNPLLYLKALAGGTLPDTLTTASGFSGQPRALLMVKIVSVFSLATANSYWLTSCYLSLFSFFGTWSLANRVSQTYRDSSKAALAAFVFLPGALFWGSGISKEAIFLGGFGLLTAWFWPGFWNGKRVEAIQWLAGIVIVVLLFQLKYYYVAVLVPVITATIIHRSIISGESHWLITYSSWLCIFFLLLFAASWLHPNLQLDHLAQLIKDNAAEIASASSQNALIQFRDHPSPLVWLGINLPLAILTGLLRPNLGDWGGFFQNLAVFEHLVIAIFLAGKIRFIRYWQFHDIDWLPCVVYVVTLSALLSLSTPNLGTLVRYQVSYLPLFLFLILYGNHWWNRLVYKLP